MSTSHSIYVGPYALCTRVQKTTEKKVKACPSTVCSSFGLTHDQLYDESATEGCWHFCSTCGTKLDYVSLPTKTHDFSTGDVSEEIKEQLYCYVMTGDATEQEDVWVPNIRWTEEPDRNPLGQLVGEHEIEDHEPAQERDVFEKEIVTLQRRYGKDNVEIKWGVLGRWS